MEERVMDLMDQGLTDIQIKSILQTMSIFLPLVEINKFRTLWRSKHGK